jgi:hypothetical protein
VHLLVCDGRRILEMHGATVEIKKKLSHSCLREIAWGVKEGGGILGQGRAREGVCIHTSSERSGVRLRALDVYSV